ncbi:hypothetical protein [Aestuariimicrobium kwangyangense]|uniref:hypothetical protein n=1 Tax=Aestuariimicrobium kwangyangense TaxID=396389 RepID=UPI0003B706DB|nr:hypothetical protein [Aestuariimicrobium kwangyangense]
MVDDPYRVAAQALASGSSDAWVRRLLGPVKRRLDLADHRLLVVLQLRLGAGDLLPDALRDEIDSTLAGFKYSFTEPGDDSMCTWSENHQALSFTCEYLAGRLLGNRVFTNDGRTGNAHADSARLHLLDWLEDRFRWGFSEWLSGTYYELDAVALTMLVDHADEELALRASMVLDLLLLDLALHHFDGRLHGSQGRAYRRQKVDPSHQEVAAIVADAFGKPPSFHVDQLSGIFGARQRYRVPQAILDIAHQGGAHRIHVSHGRTIEETIAHAEARELSRNPDATPGQLSLARVRACWAMQAITDPEVIGDTISVLNRQQMWTNSFFAGLRPFRKFNPGLGPLLVRGINPITIGMQLGRADITTFRTPNLFLSSAQHYRSGQFGDQQHLWEAVLPGGLVVFSTHPGSVGAKAQSRPATPSDWIGNGINPDIAQADNVALVLHDTRGRRGYLEGRRPELSHLHFPIAKFDETRLTERRLLGRKGDSYLAVLSSHPYEVVSDHEVLQRGPVTGWAVVLSDRSEFPSFQQFVDAASAWRLELGREGLQLTARHVIGFGRAASEHVYELGWDSEFTVNRVVQRSDHPRYETEWVEMPRGGTHCLIRGTSSTLRLDWSAGLREETGPGLGS